MPTATLTSKGQLTLPGSVRKTLRLKAGDRVDFIEVGPGRYELMVATRPLSSLKGMFGKVEIPVSIEEMNAIISHAWEEQ